MAPVAEGLILDPPEFIQNRVAVDLQQEGLEIRAEGLDYGESSAQVEMVRRAIGEGVVDRHWPAVECTVPLIVREEGDTSLAASNHNVEAKVGLWQQRGGWIRRDFADGAGHAGSVGCPVFTAGLTPVQGWSASHRQVAPDVLLKLKRWPIWYATVAIEGDEVKASGVRDIKWEIAEMLGTAPGLIRVRVKNENASADWRALISSIESEHFSSAATADLVYEAEALTPMGGAKVVSVGGTSGGKVVEHSSLTAGWLAVLGSEVSGKGHMSHTGVRRPRFRVKDTVGGLQLQLEWRSLGSTRWSPGPVVDAPISGAFQILDLGECRPELAELGDQGWQWRLLARNLGGSGAVQLDRFWPCAIEQCLVLRTPYQPPAADVASTKPPGTVENDASVVGAIEGSKPWETESGAKTSDNAYASVALTDQKLSYFLVARNFGFALPEGATVLGLMPRVERKASAGNRIRDYLMFIVKSGVLGGENHADAAHFWPTTDAVATYGGSSDLWGLPWTPASINAANFGVGLAVKCEGGSATASVDQVTMTVFYTEAVDDQKVCFATRSAELRSDVNLRQSLDGASWGRLIQESGSLHTAPAGGLEGRGVRGLIIPSQGDLDELADSGSNSLSVIPSYQPGYLFAREAAG